MIGISQKGRFFKPCEIRAYRYPGLSWLLLLMIISLSGCGNSEEAEETVKIDVETAYPTIQTISLSGDFIGTIEANDKVSVTPRISGVVTEKYVKAGDHVKAGDILFTMDDSEYQIEKKNAEANIRSAEAALAAQKARNQETKAAAAESAATLNTKSLELNNSVRSNEREEYAAAVRKDGYIRDGCLYDSEGRRLRDDRDDAKKREKKAEEFSDHLNSIMDRYKKIEKSDDPKATAKKYGVKDSDIQEATDAETIASIYLKTKTKYDSSEQLQTAIEASKEAERTAESDIRELDGSYSANMISRIEAEINARVENGNIANAQDAKLLAEKLRADYELFTKNTIIADVQAKVAEGDAAVVSSDVQLATARTELESANLKIDHTVVKSPINGIIQETNVEKYSMASDQSPAYVIYGQEGKKVTFYVAEDVRDNLANGQRVSVEKNGQQYDAEIITIGSIPDDQKKLYKVSALLGKETQELFDAGISVKLRTSIKKEKNAVTIPVGAVYYSEGKPYVFIASNGKAVKKDIVTGIYNQSDIQVISGISAEDQVIISWTSQLKDQSELNIKNKPMRVVKTENIEEEVKPEIKEEKEDEAVSDPEDSAYDDTSVTKIETTDKVNIRKGPGTDQEKLETVNAGTQYGKLGEEDGWTKISYNDGEAFINSDYVKECDDE